MRSQVIQEELKHVGEVFKQRRKEMNLSLKEVENGTSIRIGYLEAIEEGESSRLISPVYTQGFVKQYAAFLGLDGDGIVKQYPQLFSRPQHQEFDYGIGTLEVRGNPGASVKWFPNALWVVVLIMILIAAWYCARIFEVI